MTNAVDRAVDAANVGTSMAHDFTMWGMFMQADLVVKLVILILVFASVWSWTPRKKFWRWSDRKKACST